MHNINTSKNMPFFNATKVTSVIGLLMQQAAALHCPEEVKPQQTFYCHQVPSKSQAKAISPAMEESIEFIRGLTSLLSKGYAILAGAPESERSYVIGKLDPVQTDLIELQLRGLEGALKNAYRDCIEVDKELLKPYLITVAQARSAASNVNNLMGQMTKSIDVFTSSIDMEGLNALAKHGAEVFVSGRFH